MLIQQQHCKIPQVNNKTLIPALNSSDKMPAISVSQLNANQFLIQNMTDSSSLFKHPIMGRKIIINQIEFDYLNRVTRSLNEQDLNKYGDEQTNLTESHKKQSNYKSNRSLFYKNYKKSFRGNTNDQLLPSFNKSNSQIEKSTSESNTLKSIRNAETTRETEMTSQSFSTGKTRPSSRLTQTNRKNLVHSAPPKIEKSRRNSINSTHSIALSNSDTDTSSKQNKEDDDIDTEEENKIVMMRQRSKSIMRDQKVIIAKTLNVDKWLNAHKRPKSSVTKSTVMFAIEDKKPKSQTKESIEALLKSKTPSSMSAKSDKTGLSGVTHRIGQLKQLQQRRVRSVKELSELNLIDNIQVRIKKEVQENIRKQTRHENNTHFNSVVERVRSFLNQIEYSNDEFYSLSPTFIKLYKYDV